MDDKSGAKQLQYTLIRSAMLGIVAPQSILGSKYSEWCWYIKAGNHVSPTVMHTIKSRVYDRCVMRMAVVEVNVKQNVFDGTLAVTPYPTGV